VLERVSIARLACCHGCQVSSAARLSVPPSAAGACQAAPAPTVMSTVCVRSHICQLRPTFATAFLLGDGLPTGGCRALCVIWMPDGQSGALWHGPFVYASPSFHRSAETNMPERAKQPAGREAIREVRQIIYLVMHSVPRRCLHGYYCWCFCLV